jgi:long-chain acyl-CoA synthetase
MTAQTTRQEGGRRAETTIPGLLDRAVDRFGDRVAIRWEEGRLTYRELRSEARGVAEDLRRHAVRPGDRVALALSNGPEYLRALYGASCAGAVVVPLNPLLRVDEARFVLGDSGATTVLTDNGADQIELAAKELGCSVIDVSRPRPAGSPQVDETPAPSDTAVLLYTSGTTGRPKGARLTHLGLTDNSRAYAHGVLEGTEHDVLAGALPFFHVFGLTCTVLAAAQLGAQISTVRRFRGEEFLDLLAERGVTIMAGVPTMYIALLEAASLASAPRELPTLRLCVSGGAPMPAKHIRRIEHAFGAVFLEGYGLTESCGCVAFNRIDMARQPGTIGLPVPGVEVRLVDPQDGRETTGPGSGEIQIRGTNVTVGYWNSAEATDEAFTDGWFRTGDLASRAEDGVLRIIDRLKHVIIRAGYNVYPREIEEVIYSHPDVVEAVVIGMPDDRLGEEVAAAVVVRAGASVTPDDLVAYTKERVAPYKYPRVVWFSDALPRTGSGKLVRLGLGRAKEDQ